jgi:hypothetical protein
MHKYLVVSVQGPSSSDTHSVSVSVKSSSLLLNSNIIWTLQTPIGPPAFLQTHILHTFRANRLILHWRVLGSAFTIVYPLPNAHLSMCIPLQVPLAPANNQRVDIPPPGRVAEPGRMQDLHHIDVAYQGIVNYHPQPLAVSYFYLSVDRPLLINDTRAIESCIHIS